MLGSFYKTYLTCKLYLSLAQSICMASAQYVVRHIWTLVHKRKSAKVQKQRPEVLHESHVLVREQSPLCPLTLVCHVRGKACCDLVSKQREESIELR